MEYLVQNFQIFFLIMVRMVAMTIMAPFFSSGLFPLRLKVMLSFFVSMLVFPYLFSRGFKIPAGMGEYYLMIMNEVFIGVYLGFLISVIFAAFQLSGDFFAVQIGFGMSEVLDPVAQVSVPIIGQLKNLIGLLVFMAINGHHFLIEGIYKSYELAPIISMKKTVIGGLLKYLVYTFSGMFVIALKISLPVIGTIFLITISLGVLAKAAPQMNIMMLGFPIKIVVAFGVLIVISPMIVRIMQVSLERSFNFMTKILLHWPV